MRMFLVVGLIVGACVSANAATGKVIKVLPHLLDLQGRHALSPSLYERDAYQAYLQEHPEKQSGMRFDIQWKTTGGAFEPLKLKVEVRGIAHGGLPEPVVIEKEVESKWPGRWTGLTLSGREFEKVSQVTAWRVTLWEGADLLSEQKSFLW